MGFGMNWRLLAGAALCVAACSASADGLSFAVTLDPAHQPGPADGRVLLLLSTDGSSEPRLQISHELDTQIVYGVTVDGLKPGTAATVDAKAFGWPVQSLKDLAPGDYYVQAVFNRYETFHRSDGSTVKLAPDRGEGEQWNRAPGNLYSTPVKLHLDPAKGQIVKLLLDQEIPPIPPKTDTKYIRHVTITSELLSKFWGRPVTLGAHILLPEGFDEHPEAHYPLMVFHGHFPDDISGFRTEPPDPNLKPEYSERFHLDAYNRIQQEEAYKLYQTWISPHFPRYIVIEIEHANPYYDDSYAVNSANLGPYGDAINQELIPYIEAKFRGLGQGWARFTYGGSTGGWEALATQVFYPDEYNGAFAACPDPIDFRAFTVINLYEDKSAYMLEGAHRSVERPGFRNYLGEVKATQRDMNYYELALGDRGRSGEQNDIWQAVYSPEGPDGLPLPIFDKVTGLIDHDVAKYWRDHYDLSYIIQRDWSTLGPKLAGKIHLYVGRGDNYMLNDAVYYAEDVLKALKNPAADADVAYGDKDEHCWNGDKTLPNAYSRLHYNIQYLPKILEQIKKTAPKGADLTSWRY
jgi:hypothetical protein